MHVLIKNQVQRGHRVGEQGIISRTFAQVAGGPFYSGMGCVGIAGSCNAATWTGAIGATLSCFQKIHLF